MFFIFTEIFNRCPSKIIDMKDRGIYNLQELKAGFTITKECIYGGVSFKSLASIKCDMNGDWEKLNVSLCLSYTEVVGEILKVC